MPLWSRIFRGPSSGAGFASIPKLRGPGRSPHCSYFPPSCLQAGDERHRVFGRRRDRQQPDVLFRGVAMTEKEAAIRAANARRRWFDPAREPWRGGLDDCFIRHWERFPQTRPRHLTADPIKAIEPPTIDLDPPGATRGSWKW